MKFIHVAEVDCDGEQELFSVKEYCAKLETPYTQLRKRLERIYYALCLFLEDEDNGFFLPRKKYAFLISANGKKRVVCAQLDTCPRVGEQVEFPLLWPELGRSMLYVSKIYHEFTDEGHEIMISLKQGYYNAYEVYEKEKAYAQGKLSVMEYHAD